MTDQEWANFVEESDRTDEKLQEAMRNMVIAQQETQQHVLELMDEVHRVFRQLRERGLINGD